MPRIRSAASPVSSYPLRPGDHAHFRTPPARNNFRTTPQAIERATLPASPLPASPFPLQIPARLLVSTTPGHPPPRLASNRTSRTASSGQRMPRQAFPTTTTPAPAKTSTPTTPGLAEPPRRATPPTLTPTTPGPADPRKSRATLAAPTETTPGPTEPTRHPRVAKGSALPHGTPAALTEATRRGRLVGAARTPARKSERRQVPGRASRHEPAPAAAADPSRRGVPGRGDRRAGPGCRGGNHGTAPEFFKNSATFVACRFRDTSQMGGCGPARSSHRLRRALPGQGPRLPAAGAGSAGRRGSMIEGAVRQPSPRRFAPSAPPHRRDPA